MKKPRLALVLLLITAPIASNADPVVEVIPVYNRPASEIQPLLMPLLEITDQVVANGDTLIVKSTPERMQTLTNLIRKLDYPLNNLLISVIQSRNATAEQLNAETGYEFNAQFQDPYNPESNANVNGNSFQGRIYHQNSQQYNTKDNRNIQTIRVLDSATAHIKVGNTYPIANYQIYPGGYGYPGVTQSTEFVEASTGFDVTPRLAGNQVVLDVAPWSDRFNGQGQIQSQAAQTSIRANLGEWVEIGGVDESGQSSRNLQFGYHYQTGQNNLHILVKVDVIN